MAFEKFEKFRAAAGKATPGIFRSRKEAFNAAKKDLGIPRGQQPDVVKHVKLEDKGRPGTTITTREYHFTKSDGSKFVIQEHSAGHKFGQGGVGDQGPHYNVRLYNPDKGDGFRNRQVPGTREHYSYKK